jgi:hypothetical protein
MVPPIINLNGSDPARLLAEYKAAHAAVVDAYRALREVDVHGRDYQSSPDRDLGRKAREARHAHLERLNGLADELVEVCLAIQDQIDERAARQAFVQASR